MEPSFWPNEPIFHSNEARTLICEKRIPIFQDFERLRKENNISSQMHSGLIRTMRVKERREEGLFSHKTLIVHEGPAIEILVRDIFLWH